MIHVTKIEEVGKKIGFDGLKIYRYFEKILLKLGKISINFGLIRYPFLFELKI